MVRKSTEKESSSRAKKKLREVMRQLGKNTEALREMVEKLRDVSDHTAATGVIFRARINGRKITCAHPVGDIPDIRVRARGFEVTANRNRLRVAGKMIRVNNASYGSCNPDDWLEVSLDGTLLVNGVRRDQTRASRSSPSAQRRIGRMPSKAFKAASNGLPSLRARPQ